MNNRDAYREHRPRTSLDHVQGRSPTSEAAIRAMASKALKDGVIVFLVADLAKLPWASREIIETEARKLYGRR